MAEDLSVLLVGYGLAGRVFHAPLIRTTSGMAIRGIVTANAERSVQAHEDHPDAAVFSGLDEALHEPFDLVVIASANVTHVPYTKAALDAGHHVVLDKPVAGTAAAAADLAARAVEADRLLIPFQNRRWDSDFLTAQHVAEQGALGLVHRFESHIDRMRVVPKAGWRGSPDPADLGGMLLDLGAHLVDQSLALMGPAISVAATVRSVRPLDPTDDDVVLLITHDSGGVSVLSASQIAGFGEPRMTLLGTHGALRITHSDSQEDVLRTGVLPSEDWGHEPAGTEALLRTYTDDNVLTQHHVSLEHGAWPTFYRQVAAAVRGHAEPPVVFSDAVQNLRVLDAARTAGTTATTVTLDPPAAHASAT